jgi:hypothetical protein
MQEASASNSSSFLVVIAMGVVYSLEATCFYAILSATAVRMQGKGRPAASRE